MVNEVDTDTNITLIGFSATGKSIIAREVAKRLGWNCVDTDEEIVKLSGKSVPEIFNEEGEDRFRELECQVLRKACQEKKTVIASGGGAILSPENRELLTKSGTVICLEAKPETVLWRLLENNLQGSSHTIRPLLVGSDPLKRIEQLKSSRQIYYTFADWTIHTDNLTLAEVSQEVIRGWQYINRYSRNREQVLGLEPGFACNVRTLTASYPVFVGWCLLDRLGERMRQVGLSGVVNVISDEAVFPIYGERVRKVLEGSGYRVNHFTVPPGEVTKSIDQTVKIYDFLVEHRTERKDVIIALGGGMIGDLAGFVAATFLRGLPWVQVPTSLIAMVDASIGGKVAVNHVQGKNLVGAFYQPSLVLSDVQTLTTLPQRELVSGWAEVIKHALILDPELFELLEANAEDLIKLTPDITAKLIARSASIKGQVVTDDEKETGNRIILNYGHTIAHSLETATRYEHFLHGEAVAIGMMGAAKLSHRLGLLSQNVVERQQSLLERFYLPVDCPSVNPADLVAAMELDKKKRQKAIQWVLLKGIGDVIIHSNVPQEDILEVLRGLTDFKSGKE